MSSTTGSPNMNMWLQAITAGLAIGSFGVLALLKKMGILYRVFHKVALQIKFSLNKYLVLSLAMRKLSYVSFSSANSGFDQCVSGRSNFKEEWR